MNRFARRRLTRLVVLTPLVSFAANAAATSEETLLLQDPSISAEHVVFVYAEDLWAVGRSGGEARRLTSNPGAESSPEISPDGKWVAFTGQYDGNVDVYVVPVAGGDPRRLTWHPGGDVVVDWHPDGKRILFRSSRSSNAPVQKLFLVGIEREGLPEELSIPKVAHAAYSPDGKRVAYTPFRDAFRSWKRHRGGTIPPVWIIDLATFDVEEVPHVHATDTFPGWVGDDVYFASDRDGHMNLWRYTPGSSKVEQVTRFDDFDIRNMDAGDGVIVFEQAGALHVYDPTSGRTERLRVHVRADGLAALPRWQAVQSSVRNAAIAPNGKRAVFETRGEIVTVPKEHGDPRNLTQSPGAHDRDPAWSHDGERIAWFSDEGGEYRLLIRDHLGRKPVSAYDLDGAGFYHDPRWSPDGKHVLFSDKANRIAYLTVETGGVTEVARVQGSLGVVQPAAVWSPDSKWIAFENRNPRTMYDQIALYELETSKTTGITDAFGTAASPAFSRDGKHMFFAASVDAGPRLFGLDMSTSASRTTDNSLYVVVLQKAGKNPLAPKSDEAVGSDGDDDMERMRRRFAGPRGASPGDEKEGGDAAGTDADAESKKDKEKKVDVPPIELDGIDQRILALPLGSSGYRALAGLENGVLYLEYAPSGGRPELKKFDLDDLEADTVARDVFDYELSADGSWILVRGLGGWSIRRVGGGFGGGAGPDLEAMAAAGRGSRGGGGGGSETLRLDSVRVRVDPEQEWPQILREVWRIQRDYFYDENMHGVDWPAMWRRWSAFLPHVRHRADLNVIIAEMIGELACGHQYAGGGDMPDAPDGVSVGLLGADWEIAKNRYRIARIYSGQNWSPGLRAPLTEPGVDAREGDYLITVDGRPVMADDNLYAAFENTANRQVLITLASKPDGLDARSMTVVPISNEFALRRQSWIEDNRRRVDELSNGRLAYIYMPNTGGAGMAAFDRDFYSQLDRDGVILDERYNGGGQVANYVIDVLSRRVMSYWMNREKWLAQSPFGMIDGPKVMLINESAGSGGDWMPWMFQNRGIGPLVGTRTWGGLVGISGYPPLMDGGFVTAASFGVMDTDGRWAVENVGVAPDYEVVEWPKEVIAGHDPQLEKAVSLALEELGRNPKKPRPQYHPPAAR